MTPEERTKAIEELTARLQYFSSERLRLLLKSSQPVTDEDIINDIKEGSKTLR